MAKPTADIAKPAGKLVGKYLSFRLGAGQYAVGVLRVREIIRPTAFTATPGMPGYILGVINLRGRIIPVADLRRRFGLGQAANQDKACVIVTELQPRDEQPLPMGLLVDAVEEVLNLTEDEVEAPPRFGSQADIRHLLGMAKTQGGVTSLLDVDHLLAGNEIRLLQTACSN